MNLVAGHGSVLSHRQYFRDEISCLHGRHQGLHRRDVVVHLRTQGFQCRDAVLEFVETVIDGRTAANKTEGHQRCQYCPDSFHDRLILSGYNFKVRCFSQNCKRKTG